MPLIARGRDGLEAAAKEAERAGSEVLALSADVAREAEIEDAAASVEQEFEEAEHPSAVGIGCDQSAEE